MRCDVDPDEVSARARSSPLTFRRDSVTQSIRIGFSVHRTQRPRGALDDLFRDHDFLYAFEARQVEHRVEQDTFHDRAQSARPGLAVDGLAGNGAKRLLRQREIDRFHLEQPLVLLHQRVLGLGENELEGGLVEILERGHDRQSADEFGDQAIFQQVLRLDLTENFAGATVFRRNYLGAEADRGRPPAGGNDLLEPIEGAAAYKQDVGGVDGMMRMPLWLAIVQCAVNVETSSSTGASSGTAAAVVVVSSHSIGSGLRVIARASTSSMGHRP